MLCLASLWTLAALFCAACATSQDDVSSEPEPDRSPRDASSAGQHDAGRDAGGEARDSPSAASTSAPAAGPDAETPALGDDAGRVSAEAGTPSCASSALCSDFEAEKPGALTGAWAARSPNCSGDGKATIDETIAHSGKKSLRVQSGGGTCNHVFATPALDFATLGAAFWVRFYVRFDSALSDAHVTFLAMQDQVSKKALRMGGQKKILMWNRELDDATLPELSPNGIAMSVAPRSGQFQCVEFHLDGAAGTLETHVEGTRVPGLVIDGIGSQDIDGQWLRSGTWSAQATEIGFGWESYGGEPMLLWFDDIAISAQRLGC